MLQSSLRATDVSCGAAMRTCKVGPQLDDHWAMGRMVNKDWPNLRVRCILFSP